MRSHVTDFAANARGSTVAFIRVIGEMVCSFLTQEVR